MLVFNSNQYDFQSFRNKLLKNHINVMLMLMWIYEAEIVKRFKVIISVRKFTFHTESKMLSIIFDKNRNS